MIRKFLNLFKNNTHLTKEYFLRNGFKEVENGNLLDEENHIVVVQYDNVIDKETEHYYRIFDGINDLWNAKYIWQLNMFLEVTQKDFRYGK